MYPCRSLLSAQSPQSSFKVSCSSTVKAAAEAPPSPGIAVSWKAEYHHRNQLQKQTVGSCPIPLVKQFVLRERQGHKWWKLIKVNAAGKVPFCFADFKASNHSLCVLLWKDESQVPRICKAELTIPAWRALEKFIAHFPKQPLRICANKRAQNMLCCIELHCPG